MSRAAAVLLAALLAGCGVKGPPRPPTTAGESAAPAPAPAPVPPPATNPTPAPSPEGAR